MTIGEEVFWNKSLNSVAIPDSLTQIDNAAFRFNNLKEVALPRNLEVLGRTVFASNPLEKITISACNEKFKSTTNGEGLYTKNGETIIQGTIHAIFENSTKHIGQFAFFQIGLTEVEIPNHIETIGQHAFRANNLTEIIIPNNVKEIGFGSFMGNNLETLVLSEELTALPNDVFMDNNLKEVIIPKNITQVGRRSFSNNNLEEVTILNEGMGFWPDTFSGNQTNPKDITIHGYAGSTAETYAADNDHTFSAFIIPAIPDDALRKAINAELGKGDSYEPTIVDLEGLTKLSASNKGIEDLTGLEYANNLQELSLSWNDITDFGVITNFIDLKKLDLSGNNVGDISFLSNLVDLEVFNAMGSNISDISVLSNLNKLEILTLNNNSTINDFDALSELENLRTLRLSSTGINDISVLATLTNLEELILGQDKLGDLSALSGLTNLKTLSLRYSQTSDISPLRDLTNLRRLIIDWNEIGDISPLAGLTDLRTLEAGRNNISDISPLENLSWLSKLEIDYNHIGDLSPLDGMNLNDSKFGNQTIKLPKVDILSTSNEFEIDNPIIGIDGTVFNNIVVEEGSYNSPKIKWDELNGTEQTRKFTFDDGTPNGFSGTVTQPIDWIKDIVGVVNIPDIVVMNGTGKSDLGLPTNVEVTLDDGTTQNIDVEWDDGDPTFDKFVARNYVFTGTLDLPSGVVNTNNFDVSVTVKVGDPYITEITDIANIGVINGTEMSDIGLPTKVEVTLNDGNKQNIDVNWDNGNPNYDKSVAGNYVFTGTLDLPTGVVNTNNVEASVTVTVGNPYITEITDIANIGVINGTEMSDIGLPTKVEVTLNDGNKQNIDVNWDNGNPNYDKSVAGNYVFTGTLDLPTSVINTNNVEASVTVTVGDLYITDVDAIANITVTNGTDKSDIGLPEDIEITLNDGSTQNVDVNWDNGDPSYNKFVARNYVFTGTLDLLTGVVTQTTLKHL